MQNQPQQDTSEQLDAKVARVVFRNEQNAFTVLEVLDKDGEEICAVGNLPQVRPGEAVRLWGSWQQHREYGTQFGVSALEVVAPSSRAEVLRYLSSGSIRGVGEKTAQNIYDAFGADTLDVLAHQPERLAKVKGVGQRRAQQIHESFVQQGASRNAMLELARYDITPAQAAKLIHKYGDNTIAVLRENPYRMVQDVQGIGFRIADKIALAMGMQRNAAYRIDSGIQYTLVQAMGDGHTALPATLLLEQAATLLELSQEEVGAAAERLILAGALWEVSVEAERMLALEKVAKAEFQVARKLEQLYAYALCAGDLQLEGLLEQLQQQKDIQLAAEQQQAVLMAAQSGISIITGGPGTGKTTIINFIIDLLNHMHLEVALCAPTGRAAKRMGEASGMEAGTIHRLLEYGRNDAEGSFGRNELEPLECEAVIVDEASMMDVFLMRALLQALHPGTRLVLVGDVDQLPAVGAGNVLRDMIASQRFPVVRLQRIFRQRERSGIVLGAHAINNGEMPALTTSCDFAFAELPSVQRTAQAVVHVARKYAQPDAPGLGLQVLTPMKKGDLGVYNLNKLLQQALNPPRPELPELRRREEVLRQGDKVMQIRNNYQTEWTCEDAYGTTVTGTGVYNGDIGRIVAVERDGLWVQFDDDKRARYPIAQLDELELAYCITIHKSQGSEFEMVVLPVYGGPPMLMTRNLLYTALTRARKRAYLLGTSRHIHTMVQNNFQKKRYTLLRHSLQEGDKNIADLLTGWQRETVSDAPEAEAPPQDAWEDDDV